ncbi:hypothetical protein SETIT_1G203600v2 [Setaria italica]|uniref:Terpene synthase TPS6 n=1 Tax=Setaria italica TaxID=4555 RepID=A0A368PMU6_SETIT|nr:terpene synthase TPS6 [Setaria italica]RCV06933.1 hypothetical protein SETIT_1G203600v2 [Setaria italica]
MLRFLGILRPGQGASSSACCNYTLNLDILEPRDTAGIIGAIRVSLRSMGDGEISVSAYDTAWVALVKSMDGGDGPHFPSSIDWIVQNQLYDGSWGDCTFFYAHDRIINTLACVIALASWGIHAEKCEKGLSFIRENMWRLVKEDEDWMLVGFEIALPSLLEMAKDLDLDIPYDHPALQEIYDRRDLKLNKIPKDVLHSIPTTLLHSIEGMPGLDWKRLLNLRFSDGSFMSSPAATAYALMETGDRKCLEFLGTIVNKFNGGAPFLYPVEIYERLWAIDRLERLGISSYFRCEIDDYLTYVYRHWTEEGLGYTRDCAVKDIDDTAMAFRLLRLHGYHVSPCVFKRFEKEDGEFVVYPGQSNQSVSAMYNMYRAADQAAFPGDDGGVLRRARRYCRAFLQGRRASGQLSDKWLIAEGLPGEVAYGLDFPWKASLPRVETRMYLEQYGGGADVWIGKVLYRMHLFNNDLYLKMAKADFISFQRSSRAEWHGLQRWCDKNNLEMYGVTSERALRAYFLAAANIFEPERAAERLGWAQTAVLAEAVTSHILSHSSSDNTRERILCRLASGSLKRLEHAFLFIVAGIQSQAKRLVTCVGCRGEKDSTAEDGLLNALNDLIDHLTSGNASDSLQGAWKQWLMEWTAENGSYKGNTALLLVRSVEICSGRLGSTEQNQKLPEYSQLEQLTYSICSKLGHGVHSQVCSLHTKNVENLDGQVDEEMQELAQSVSQISDPMNRVTKQTFLHVARSYCYVAHCSPETIDSHISKVLFEEVI